MSLYPTGTIVRFTFGPLNIFEDVAVSPPVPVEDPKAVMGKAVVWAGGEGIYVRPINGSWHLVMTERGDVPVLPAMIESHPNYRLKNEALMDNVSPDLHSEPKEASQAGRASRVQARHGQAGLPVTREASLSPATISAIDQLAHTLRMEVDDLRDDDEFVEDDENLMAWLDALETMSLGLDKLPVRMQIELRPIEE